MLTKGRRKFVSEVSKNLATVAFAASFASGFFAEVPGPWKYVLVAGIAVILTVGFVAAID